MDFFSGIGSVVFIFINWGKISLRPGKFHLLFQALCISFATRLPTVSASIGSPVKMVCIGTGEMNASHGVHDIGPNLTQFSNENGTHSQVEANVSFVQSLLIFGGQHRQDLCLILLPYVYLLHLQTATNLSGRGSQDIS